MSKKYQRYDDDYEKGDSILYQAYDSAKKAENEVIIEDFYEKNDKKALKYKNRFYGKKVSLRRVRVKIEYQDIKG